MTTTTTEFVWIDGGMSQNPTFVQALADATERPIEVSPVVEATTIGQVLRTLGARFPVLKPRQSHQLLKPL